MSGSSRPVVSSLCLGRGAPWPCPPVAWGPSEARGNELPPTFAVLAYTCRERDDCLLRLRPTVVGDPAPRRTNGRQSTSLCQCPCAYVHAALAAGPCPGAGLPERAQIGHSGQHACARVGSSSWQQWGRGGPSLSCHEATRQVTAPCTLLHSYGTYRDVIAPPAPPHPSAAETSLSYRHRPPKNKVYYARVNSRAPPTLTWLFAAQATVPPRAASSRRPMARFTATAEPAAAGRTCGHQAAVQVATTTMMSRTTLVRPQQSCRARPAMPRADARVVAATGACVWA